MRSPGPCPAFAVCFVLSLPLAALAAAQEWTPERVAEAIRLQEIVFLRERIQRQNPWGTNNYFVWTEVRRGDVAGLGNLLSAEAAKDGERGLRLALRAETPDSAWRITLQPELIGAPAFRGRGKPYFDAYGYRPRGTVEFDLRGDARGRGLGVTFACTHRSAESAPLTPLDPYLADGDGWQHVVVPVADVDLGGPETLLYVADRLAIGSDGFSGSLKVDLDNLVLRSDGPEPERGPVRVDHVGYAPGGRKAGLVAGSRLFGLDGVRFVVRRADVEGNATGEPVYEGRLTLKSPFEPRVYGEWVYEADFTPLTGPGRYVLDVPGVGASVPFFVNEALYDYLFHHLGRFFFFQRNGCALPPANAFEWARGEVYTAPIPLASDESRTRLVRHGWIDAGDSRVFPHTRRIGPLLLAWEMSGDKHFDGQLNIPESGNGVPDMLDEVRWQVEFLREVQLEDGACLGYLMTGKRGGNPERGYDAGYENDPDPRFIRDDRFSYDESVRICASFAMMARCLRPHDARAARTYEDCALRAWRWARANEPEAGGRRGGDPQDDVFWAAVELWRLTKDPSFHAVVEELAGLEPQWDSNAWKNDSTHVAWVSYALDADADAGLRDAFVGRFVGQLGVLFGLSAADPYGVAVCPHGWFHSPGRMGETAWLLLTAWRLTGERRYRTLAEQYLHYIGGRNCYRLCTITNVAPESVSTPFHMLEWTPRRKAWFPGCMPYMAVDHSGNLSRFVARRWRDTRVNWYFSEPCIGFNHGATAAVMLLMEGRRYDDMLRTGAFPGTQSHRPGLPFAPSHNVPWGAEPVVPRLPG
jgi:endoglucanase